MTAVLLSEIVLTLSVGSPAKVVVYFSVLSEPHVGQRGTLGEMLIDHSCDCMQYAEYR
jgi:hypothetical protein